MKRSFTLAAALLVLSAAGAQASQKLIVFDATYKGAIDKSIESVGGEVTRKFKFIDALAASFPDEVKDASIYSLPGVISVDEDSYIKWIEAAPASMNAVPLPSVKAALRMIRTGEGWEAPSFGEVRAGDPAAEEQPWGIKRVNAAGAWTHTMGKGVKVAVIDTGVDYTHPDIAPLYKGGYNYVTDTSDPMDDHGHGTHVSGTVGAARDLKGVVGVAPEVDLYGVKVLDSRGSGQYSWIVSGIEWAIENGIDVINMSLGGRSGTDALALAMTAAKKAGVTVICAAGNDSGAVNYPAKYPEAIAVSASTSRDTLAYFSSRGPEIAVIAPGYGIYSCKMGGGYTNMSGTSMASPHVAGLAALAVAAGANGPDAVRAALTSAATPLPGLDANKQGAGMVDAEKLVR